MRARLLGPAAVAVGLLSLAPAAPARTTTVANAESLVDGPTLVNGTTLWLEAGAEVRAVKPGGSPRVVAHVQLPEDYDDEDAGDFSTSSGVGFSASASHVVIDSLVHSGSSKYFQDNYSYTTSAFPRAGGNPRGIGTCSLHLDNFNGQQSLPLAPRSALDGSTAAAWSCPRALVIDLGTGQTLRELPTLGALPRVAGRFVASIVRPATGPDQIVVFDWQAGAEAYRITLAATASARAFDLQPDGSVAVTQFTGTPGCGTGALSWHSPADPAGRSSPVAPCAPAVATEGGKTAFVAESPDVAGNLVVTELASDGTRRNLGWLGTGRRWVGQLDYAGGTAAYAIRRCSGSVSILNANGPAQARAVDCLFPRISSARLAGRTLTVKGTLARTFTGRLELSYKIRVGRRILTVRRTMAAANGKFAGVLRAPREIRSRRAARRGRVRVTFSGNQIFQAGSVSRTLATAHTA